MSTELIEAVERLRLRSDDAESRHDGCIDDILDENRPRKRKRPNVPEIKEQLEHDFLTPPTVFGPDWLNKFQQ